MKRIGSHQVISWKEMIYRSGEVKWGGAHDFGNHGWFSALFTDESLQGSFEGHFFRSGFMIFLIDLYVDKDLEITTERHEPIVGFGLIIQGLSARAFKDGSDCTSEIPLHADVNIISNYHGRTSLKLAGGQRHKMVSVKIKKMFIPQLFEEKATHLLQEQSHLLVPSESVGVVFQKALSPSLACLGHQVFGCTYEGSARRLFMEAKALEILACQLEELAESIPHESTLRGAVDRERLHQARVILETEFADPPTLLALARRVGLNDFKLKCGFREVFGTTVFGYVRKLRMQKAKQLLETSDMSITQVALSVGYNSISHFTTAFKRSVGILPSQYRRAKMKRDELSSVSTVPEKIETT